MALVSAIPNDTSAPHSAAPHCELTVLLPCLNEVRTLGSCVVQARQCLDQHAIDGEILVADNGSTDGSGDVARQLGARVIDVARHGYGSALLGGIAAALGDYVIMADADGSYDFGHIPRFLERLRAGDDLVMGNRFLGGIEPGAMPFLNRYVGNPMLTGMGRLLFGGQCRDFHCGMRGFRTQAIRRLNLSSPGMEFASEMVIVALGRGLRLSEVPTTLAPDGRDRRPHLRPMRDGWRHLRLMLALRWKGKP
jgi:glycosyltransferase involved in cell wall biosynthesis